MKTIYTLSAIPLALLLWTGCKNKDDKSAAAAAPPATPVNVTEAQRLNSVYYDQYQGTVTALSSVELRAQVTGYITGIFFKEGEVVPKGKLLYEIDRRNYEAAYQQAKASLASSEANLVRAKKDADRYSFLLKQDAVARQTYDQAVATLATAQAQVASSKAGVSTALTNLSYSRIVAPFTGRIGISQVRLGAQVTPGTTLLNTISSENPIGVDIVINEQSVDRFYDLQKHTTDSTFRLKLSTGSMYNQKGRIYAIDRGVNSLTGSVKVRVQFPNPQDSLRDGMSGVLNVLNDQSGERVQIPYKAVTEQMGEYFVFLQADTVAKQQKIILGPRIGENVVVMDGVKEGQKVITEGFQRLRDGGKITIGMPPAQGAQGGTGAPAGGAQGGGAAGGGKAEEKKK
ncbi:efflux RND transporter periplasmic adaptor subunit [Mucilaginibacter aquatilis]|uniref:Efflux RND transporter periplasmic adaptor subunit n=1 Tax=Mucilaginibacter aquatilis TaxID=1517760 RepID=A0A6I4IPB3_9SPHI|nr:efflux RND transporter periplasmic adaptor subunit [Mucilaginibacter aquatilis]MVN89683.1 efflux RND transporter periplasmic adaptor subunit [Mucilaginibacter aquatilis]